MGGIYQSLFDNPHRYKWEPDKQTVPKDLKVVKQKPEDWPDGTDYRYRHTKGEELRLADKIAKGIRKIEKQNEYLVQYAKLIKERDRMKKKLQNVEEELKEEEIKHKDIVKIKKEIGQYKKDIVVVGNKIYRLKNYTIAISNLRDLLESIPRDGDDCIIQICDGVNGEWLNCRFTMLRVVLNPTVARGLVPVDDNAVVDP
jgi:hypothetical protein